MKISNYIASRGAMTFKTPIKIAETACAGGKIEKQGPFGDLLDVYADTDDMHTGTFEKAEAEMVRLTVGTLMAKAGVKEKNIDLLIAGDLMNQCTATAYGLGDFDIPYLGLYGACSTFAAGLLTAALLIESGQISTAIVAASSHFCSAERQFRYPLEYGSVSGMTAQTTVTGSGAALVSRAERDESGVMLTGGMYGIVCDRGIKDGANMGAAMATAAADTVLRFLSSTGESIDKYNKIATGDLGSEGLSIAKEMLREKHVMPGDVLCDCGDMIYDAASQDVGCGGSGCGCSAVMTAGHFYNAMKNGEIDRMALVGTGALMSPQSLLQGLSIPGIGHLVRFERA